MTHDSTDTCSDPPADFGTGVEYQRRLAAETADERWERYQETDERRAELCHG